MCLEMGEQLQEGTEESKELRKELRIAKQQSLDAEAALGSEAGGLDVAALLIELTQTKAQLNKMKKYSGGGGGAWRSP